MPSIWNGQQFDTELEARWASVLSEWGLRFEYHPTLFHLRSGDHVPDFLLPDQDIWIEIKHQPPNDADRQASLDLHRATGKCVLLIDGFPWPGQYSVLIEGILEDEPYDAHWQLADCRRCDGLCLGGIWHSDGSDKRVGKHTCGDHDRSPIVPDPDDESSCTWESRPGIAYQLSRKAEYESFE